MNANTSRGVRPISTTVLAMERPYGDAAVRASTGGDRRARATSAWNSLHQRPPASATSMPLRERDAVVARAGADMPVFDESDPPQGPPGAGQCVPAGHDRAPRRRHQGAGRPRRWIPRDLEVVGRTAT